jgi:hypothetical protein
MEVVGRRKILAAAINPILTTYRIARLFSIPSIHVFTSD